MSSASTLLGEVYTSATVCKDALYLYKVYDTYTLTFLGPGEGALQVHRTLTKLLSSSHVYCPYPL